MSSTHLRACLNLRHTKHEGREMEALRLSRFAHFVDIDDAPEALALYNAANLNVVFVHRGLRNTLANLDDPRSLDELPPATREPLLALVEELVERRILVAPEHDEEESCAAFFSDLLDRQRVHILYLLLADECNFDCRYCYVKGDMPKGYRPSRMSAAIVKSALDLYARCAPTNGREDDNERTVIFYGGEPLVNFEAMRFAVNYIKELILQGKLSEPVGLVLNTNASLVTPNIAYFLAANKISVSVSLDGPKGSHDANRVYPSGRGTFEDTMRGFRLLQRADVHTSVSCTVTEQNIGTLPDVFLWLVEALGLKSLGFNLLLDTAASSAEDPCSYSARATAKLIECFRLARDMGVHEDRMMRKVKAFVDGRVYPNDCAGCGQQIVVAPDGQMGVCTGFVGTRKYFTELTPGLDPHNHPIWQEWRRRSPLLMPKCYDCIQTFRRLPEYATIKG